jgi:hypothetical protein
MTMAAVIIAIVLAFLAFRFIKGMIKFGVIVLIGIGLVYLFKTSGLH